MASSRTTRARSPCGGEDHDSEATQTRWLGIRRRGNDAGRARHGAGPLKKLFGPDFEHRKSPVAGEIELHAPRLEVPAALAGFATATPTSGCSTPTASRFPTTSVPSIVISPTPRTSSRMRARRPTSKRRAIPAASPVASPTAILTDRRPTSASTHGAARCPD